MTTIPTTILTTTITTIPTTITTTIPTTITTTIPTTITTTIPTTIATTIPTTITTTIPTTITTTIPTTIITTIPTTIITTLPTTIITTIPTTIITTIPTTVMTTIPTTTITTIPTTTITTIPTTITTTIPTTIMTTIPTTSLTEIQSTIFTTIPTTKTTTLLTTLITEIPTTVLKEQCKWGILVNFTSSYSNISSADIYDNKIKEIIRSYCLDGSSVIVNGEDGKFQITRTRNEITDSNNNLAKVDLTECENILKEKYNIDPSAELIILKFSKFEEQNVHYEIYNPFTFEKLNLSYCENTTVDLFIPIEMDEKTEEIYNDIKDQGYEPLDLNDKFYREICTPYTSENGTDVLLDDREEFIYTSLVNTTVCPSECNYSEFIVDKKYIKCECDTNASGIETLDLEHLSGKNIGNSFLSTLKATNWKVMRCYNLVFNFKIFKHNYGSILILILFEIYVLFMIYYSMREVEPLKVKISKMVFDEADEEEKITQINKLSNNPLVIKTKQKIKGYAPPKKQKTKLRKSKHKNEAKIDIKSFNTENNDLVAQNISKTKRKETQRTTLGVKSSRKMIKDKGEQDEKKAGEKKLDNFELNNLDYDEACKSDKRSCCRIYISVLMREHSALLTFFACNDYNLFYIKIEKFFILFCVDMTMSGLFFVHETMHRKYTEGENFTFVQKLPQLLFTLIVAHILEVILCYFSMTDTHYYEIKALPLKDKKRGEKILDIISCMKRKLVSFFVITFILFLFFWYFISAFCAVYQNTQKIYLRDSMISFATSLLDPFFIYGLTSLLRWISLTRLCRKKCCCGCVFKISDFIPIF